MREFRNSFSHQLWVLSPTTYGRFLPPAMGVFSHHLPPTGYSSSGRRRVFDAAWSIWLTPIYDCYGCAAKLPSCPRRGAQRAGWWEK